MMCCKANSLSQTSGKRACSIYGMEPISQQGVRGESTPSPRTFISYSWTSPDHEARVLALATELRKMGVDVILDKWDLRPGHDAYAFMEQMVSDPGVKKVILVCDRGYEQKADARAGGVGAEAQIISAEIYQRVSQDKFVAVVFERDENGRACVPAYYRSRIHIDLSDPSSYHEGFDQPIRWIFDKPVYEKPEIGRTFVSSPQGAVILTTSAQRRALDAIREGRTIAVPAVIEYFQRIAEQMEKVRLDTTADPFHEAVIASIDSLLPSHNDAAAVFVGLAMYVDEPTTAKALHRLFETLLPFMDCPEGMRRSREWDFDNYRFIVHELFLYAVAALLRHERFKAVAELVGEDFYVDRGARQASEAMVPFTSVRRRMESLEQRKRDLKLNRVSLRADLLRDRCSGSGFEFRQIVQADFVLFVRSSLHLRESEVWFPETYPYAMWSDVPFEIFARSKSRRYFERIVTLLDIESKDELSALVQGFRSGSRWVPHVDGVPLDVGGLLGLGSLCTAP